MKTHSALFLLVNAAVLVALVVLAFGVVTGALQTILCMGIIAAGINMITFYNDIIVSEPKQEKTRETQPPFYHAA